jgi:integrase
MTPDRGIEQAALGDADETPLPDGLTPHSLRRTFASILVATGNDPVYVMGQMGHTDPKFTVKVYARAATARRRTRTATRSGPRIPRQRKGARRGDGPLPEVVRVMV